MLNWLKSLGKKRSPDKKRVVDKKASDKKSILRNKKSSAKRPHSASMKAKKDAKIIGRGEHGISRKKIDPHALKVLYRLHNSGFQACLVGGAVRDLLIGVTPKDFDVATDATPEQVNRLFRNCRLIGRRFRLAHVHFGRQIIEVATFRGNHDLSTLGVQDDSGRIVRDNVFGDIGEDVWRRDFTVNALYYDISDFSVIDYVGGFEDIKQKRLRIIGDVETRYREDPVRMLRALRFSAKLDFDIDELCKKPIHPLGELLQDIPAARLYEEVLKLFHSGSALQSFKLLREFDLLQYLFPAADHAIKHNEIVSKILSIAMQNTDDRIKNDMRVTPAFLLAALLWHPVNTRAKEIMSKGMPYSVAIQKAATNVLSKQSAHVSIPKRFTSTMRDIWGLQTRFHYRSGKRAAAVLEHEKFRAGYDFLCIRAQAGEQVSDGPASGGQVADGNLEHDCQWWTDIQEKNAEQQKKTLFATAKKSTARKRKRSPAKKKVNKATEESNAKEH